MSVVVRPAVAKDAEALGRMGAGLARQHHAFDPLRFMLPEDVEAGYQWWLDRERRNKKAVVIVAERDGEVVGYCYGRLEGKDWNKLLDGYGELIDIWVEERARGQGIGALLVREACRLLTELGAPRVVLMSASKNEAAQRLFRQLGFRPTMVEMTREANGPS